MHHLPDITQQITEIHRQSQYALFPLTIARVHLNVVDDIGYNVVSDVYDIVKQDLEIQSF